MYIILRYSILYYIHIYSYMLLNIWEFHGNVGHQFSLTSSQHKVRPLELALERPADRVLERLILLWEAPEYIYIINI